MKKELILVVEDENIVALDIQQGLKHLGYDVPAIVGSGDEAIEKARELAPDLILMDIQIKGSRDGIETAQIIWDSMRIPVIFLTAYADERTLERAKGPEPFGYILKPFEENELHTAIEVALRKHRMVQSQLAESEKRFQLLVESVKDYAILMLDPDGRVATWNIGAERIKGYSADEIIGKHYSIFYPEDSRHSHLSGSELTIVAERGRCEQEGWRARKDGSLYWANEIISAVRDGDGKLVGFGKVTRDLTARKKIEDRAKFLAEVSTILSYSLDLQTTLNEMANLIVPSMADWCIIDLFDGEGTLERLSIAHKNPDKRKLAEELKRRFPADLEAKHGVGAVVRSKRSELIPEFSGLMIEEISNGRDQEFVRIITSLGHSSYVCVPLISRDRVLGAITLISESVQRRFGPEDLDLAEELARRAAHAVENATLYKDAQTAIRARDEFLSIASHELKTPLTTLRLQTQMMSRKLKKSEQESFPKLRIIEFSDQLDKQVDRLVHLVEDMLDVARIGIGKFIPKYEEINLSILVGEILERMGPQLVSVGCEARVHSASPVIGNWDRFRIEQVLLNLLSNAAKYGAGKPIDVTVSALDGHAIIKIKDHGMGIAKLDQQRIFKRYERAVSASEVSGLGLGLYIATEILKAHGGTIRVGSEVGQGAEFIAELPLRPT